MADTGLLTNEDDPINFEQTHVHEVYLSIASHFSLTRYVPWPKVQAFLLSLPPYSLVADVGCGNGKYLITGALRGSPIFLIGTDRCVPLLAIASSRGPGHDAPDNPTNQRFDVASADALVQPFRSAVFDAALNIAVVHHLFSTERRVQALRETARLLRVGGRALIYVWALERPDDPPPRKKRGQKMLSRRFETQDVLVPWHLRKKKPGATDPKILGGTSKVYHRYYHVYKKGELESELSRVKGITVLEVYYDHQNWCAIIERTAEL